MDAVPDDTFPLGRRRVRRLGYGAWLLSLRPHVLAIPGTASVVHLEEDLAVGRPRARADHFALLDRA